MQISHVTRPIRSTTQNYLASSDMSSVWNSCTCFSDVISCGNQQCVKKCWLVSQGKDRKETKLITDPLMIMVSSVKYTFKWVRATVSLKRSGRSNFSSPLRLGEWYKETLTTSLKFWTRGRSMVLELCSPRDPLVCSNRTSTLNNWSEALDLFTASWIPSTYQKIYILP